MQTATRDAAQPGVGLIRKMRPSKESHAAASVKGHGGLFSKAVEDEFVWNVNEASDVFV